MSTSFMGLVVKPGKKSKVTIPDGVKFSANQATLGDVASPGRSSLLVTRLDAETGKETGPHVLTNLTTGNLESQFLGGIMFCEEVVWFEVIGSSEIHLSGVLIEDVTDEEGEDESDSEEEEPELASSTGSKKRAAPDGPSSSAAAAKKKRAADGAKAAEDARIAAQQAADAKAEAAARREAAEAATAAKAAKAEKEAARKSKAEAAKATKAAAAAEEPDDFDPCRKFNGARKGCIFQKGHMGTGYYRDLGPMAKGRAPVPKREAKPKAAKPREEERAPAQWQSMKGGLKYKELTAGKGPAGKRGSKVSCKYVLRLKNDKGRVIDKSGPRPFQFRLGAGEVIKAWDVALAKMPRGSKWALSVPPAMGYGRRGSPPDIPANSTLYFEIEHC